MAVMKQRAWSPYVAGIVIGLLQIPAFLLIKTALGASTSFVTVAGRLGSLLDPAIGELAYFAKNMSSAKNWWQVSLLIGIALGAYLSRRASGLKRPAQSRIWTRALGPKTRVQRMAMAFIGGFLLLFGARWAGGCASGHGLSGMGQLAVGSIVAVIFMFVGGIVTANLFRRL
jgi:uncharacterized membrane protein YedE/YeeE